MPNIKLTDYLAKRGDVLVDQDALDKLLGTGRKRAWKPKKDEAYWYFSNGGIVQKECWKGYEFVRDCLSMGNCFPSRSAAEHEAECRRITAELQRMAEDAGGVDFTDWSIPKFCVSFRYQPALVWIEGRHDSAQQGAIYFPSEESTQAAIAAIGEDRIKRFLFGVEPKEGKLL